jgi:hypothetical protein
VKVLVDDHLAVLHALGALEIPPTVEEPLLTVYGFQLRVAGALACERDTRGVLQRLVAQFGGSSVDVETLIRPDPAIVRIIDPTEHASEIARHKDGLRCNTLAAEVIAGARQEAAEVRLVPANALGQLWVAVGAAEVPRAVWRLTEQQDRVGVRTGIPPEGPGST